MRRWRSDEFQHVGSIRDERFLITFNTLSRRYTSNLFSNCLFTPYLVQCIRNFVGYYQMRFRKQVPSLIAARRCQYWDGEFSDVKLLLSFPNRVRFYTPDMNGWHCHSRMLLKNGPQRLFRFVGSRRVHFQESTRNLFGRNEQVIGFPFQCQKRSNKDAIGMYTNGMESRLSFK